MDRSQETLHAIAQAMIRSGAVPLPGGHGAWFPDLRRTSAHRDIQTDTAVRCFICLSLLGERAGEGVEYAPGAPGYGQSEPQERWNCKEWLPHAGAWFDSYCPDLIPELDQPRWACLLDAMLLIFTQWVAKNQRCKDLLPHAQSCHRTARKRLQEMTRYAAKKGRLSACLVAPAGTLITRLDERWQNVVREMEGPNASRIEMLYFLHVFHSSLGIHQHSLDVRYGKPRRPFYERLKKRLETSCDNGCSLCAAGNRIARSLETTVLLEHPNYECVIVGELQRELPPCFQFANYLTRPPLREQVRRRLEGHPGASQSLLAAHDLALVMADLVMDFLSASEMSGCGFTSSDYGYFDSLIKDRERVYKDQLKKGAIAKVEPGMTDTSPISSRPLNRRFTERMIADFLIPQVRRNLVFLQSCGAMGGTRSHYCTAIQAETINEGISR